MIECKAKGCRDSVTCSGYCRTHYARWQHRQKTGCKVPIHLYEPPKKRRTCTVKGCVRDHSGQGYCKYHYSKMYYRLHHGYDLAEYPVDKNIRGMPNGTRKVITSLSRWGDEAPTYYWNVKAEGHPLAVTYQWIAEHRLVMYKEKGPGRQQCWACHKSLTWKAKKQSNKIVVNHLNENGLDNSIDNLRISCTHCNREWSHLKYLERKFAA